MRHHRAIRQIIRSYLILEGILYVGFMLCDFFAYSVSFSSGLKYSSILLCLCFCLFQLGCFTQKQDILLLCIAFTFTVVADYFLLFTDHYVYGVLSFSVVQITYMVRIRSISSKNDNVFLRSVLVRLFCLLLVMGGLLAAAVPVDGLLCITAFYFTNFVVNVFELILLRKNPHRARSSTKVNVKRFLIGMILFLLCDIFVGLYNLTDYVSVQPGIYHIIEFIASYGMWAFYLPGQVLIALSTKRE